MIKDVMGYWPAEKNEKLASRCCTNVRKQHLSQNDVAIIRPIDFDSWFEDVNVIAPTLDTASATETITDLLKFDLVFSGRVALMSLFLVAVRT